MSRKYRKKPFSSLNRSQNIKGKIRETKTRIKAISKKMFRINIRPQGLTPFRERLYSSHSLGKANRKSLLRSGRTKSVNPKSERHL